MAVTMTEFAIDRISDMMTRNQMKGIQNYLRIGVRSGGCSGYSYSFEFTNERDEHDRIFEFGSIKVCINKKSYLFLNGMQVEFRHHLCS